MMSFTQNDRSERYIINKIIILTKQVIDMIYAIILMKY